MRAVERPCRHSEATKRATGDSEVSNGAKLSRTKQRVLEAHTEGGTIDENPGGRNAHRSVSQACATSDASAHHV